MSYLPRCVRLFGGVLLFVASIGHAQTPATAQPSQDQGITRVQADQILQELRQIRQLLSNNAAVQRPAQAPPAPQNGKVNITGLPVLGRADAPLASSPLTCRCPSIATPPRPPRQRFAPESRTSSLSCAPC
jgi:hypothetical protein